MNLYEFAEYRDRFALSAMLQRGRDLEAKSADAWGRACALRERVRREPKRTHLVEEYDAAMREWAECEVGLGNIERDTRYAEWLELQRRTA